MPRQALLGTQLQGEEKVANANVDGLAFHAKKNVMFKAFFMYKLGEQNFEFIAGHCHILASLKEGCNFISNVYEGSKCMRPCGNWDCLRDTGVRDFCPKIKDQTNHQW